MKGMAICLVVMCDLIWSLAMIGGSVYLWQWRDVNGAIVFAGFLLAVCWSAKTLIKAINGHYGD